MGWWEKMCTNKTNKFYSTNNFFHEYSNIFVIYYCEMKNSLGGNELGKNAGECERVNVRQSQSCESVGKELVDEKRATLEHITSNFCNRMYI